MRDLVDAAVAAAKRVGATAAIVLIDAGQKTTDTTDAAAGDKFVADASVVQELQDRNRELEKRMAAADSELVERQQKIDALSKAAKELVVEDTRALHAEIAHLRDELAARSVHTVGTSAEQSAPVASLEPITSLDDGKISVLAIEADLHKKLVKNGFDTIGKLRDGLLAGKLAEMKIKKDDIISIGEKLLRIPHGPSTAPHTPPAPPDVTIAATTVTGDSSVPAGHVDLTWTERLEACFRRRDELRKYERYIQDIEAKISAGGPDVDNLKVQLEKTSNMRDVLHGQQMALVFALGLNPKSRDIDAALESAGLGDLSKRREAEQMQSRLVGAGVG
jgi:hypothetical protein